MPIDSRSSLGQQLEVTEPVEIDLGQLDPGAAQLIVERMTAKGETREQAITNILCFAGKVMTEGIVHLDTATIYQKHPEVAVSVEEIVTRNSDRGRQFTAARALTVLVVRGARKVGEQDTATHESSGDDPFGFLTDLFEKIVPNKH